MATKIKINISASTSGVNSALTSMSRLATGSFASMSQAAGDFGKTLQGLGSSLTKFVTLPLIAAAGASVKFGSDLVENINKTDVVFKESAEEVKEWSNTMLNSFGIAKSTALDMASLFGDMGTSMGISTEDAAKMSTSLVELAADLTSMKNVSIDISQTALKGIFTGETESLKNLGVIMTQADLQMFALSQGIQTNIKDMTQAEKVNLRLAFVMDHTKNSQGDFARNTETAATQMRVFKESIKELSATFGTELLPVFTPIVKGLNELIQNFAASSPEFKKAVLVVGGLLAVLGPLMSIVGSGLSIFAGLSTAAATAGITIGALLTPIGWVVGGLALIATGAFLIAQNWETVGPTIMDTLGDIGKLLKEGFDLAMKLAILPEFIKNNWDTLGPIFKKVGDWIGTHITEQLLFLADVIEFVADGFQVINRLAEGEGLSSFRDFGADANANTLSVGTTESKGAQAAIEAMELANKEPKRVVIEMDGREIASILTPLVGEDLKAKIG